MTALAHGSLLRPAKVGLGFSLHEVAPPILRMKLPARVAALVTVIGLGGCARLGRLAPSHAACPLPGRETGEWRAVTESLGVNFRVPATFVEHPRDSGARRWYLHGGFVEYLMAGFIPSSSPVQALGRAPAVGMMEMTQCVDSIAGREVLVQAWRTRGGTFLNGRRLDRYDVFAVVPVHPELRFYIASGSHRRDTQRLALAVVRTIVIAAGSPPH